MMRAELLRSTYITSAAVVVAGLTVAVFAGCAAAPRQRPVRAGATDTGPGSLQATRQQLAGTWDLVSFEAFTQPDQPVQVDATGRMTYDEFGNISVNGQLEQPDTGRLTMLTLSGRAVIDVAEQRLLVVDTEGNVPFDEVDFSTASPDRFRYYEFDGDRVIMTVKDDRGQTTARLAWQRSR